MEDSAANPTALRVVSGCDFDESKRQFPSLTDHPTINTTTIRVQPLLILDLNGVLCHRSRDPPKHSTMPVLRQSLGTIALTPIIPRTDLNDFLQYLDRHFCLAIWTSAQRKTAKNLLNLLVPPNVRERLLFVWAQNQCRAVKKHQDHTKEGATTCDRRNLNGEDDDGDDGMTFEKNLDKVWQEYPLWSADNTLLVDDSPGKCAFAIANAIHPPTLHGQVQESPAEMKAGANDKNEGKAALPFPKPSLSDEENEQMQSGFFRKLVNFWIQCPYESPKLSSLSRPSSSGGDGDMANTSYYQFLETHAATGMGWRSK